MPTAYQPKRPIDKGTPVMTKINRKQQAFVDQAMRLTSAHQGWIARLATDEAYQMNVFLYRPIHLSMWIDGGKKILAAAFVSLLSVPAVASLNCEKPGGRVEARICELQKETVGADFLSLDVSLNAAYRLALESTVDKRRLRADQRAWIAERNECHSGTCFREAYRKRIFELSEIARSKAKFEGRWERCSMWQGEKACSSFSLLQQGKRICGEWSLWASGRVYEGQLMAEQLEPDRAEWRLSCDAMRPGCPGASITESDWGPTKSEFLLCDGVIHFSEKKGFGEPVSECKKIDERDGLLRVPIDRNSWEELREQPWMKTCLEK